MLSYKKKLIQICLPIIVFNSIQTIKIDKYHSRFLHFLCVLSLKINKWFTLKCFTQNICKSIEKKYRRIAIIESHLLIGDDTPIG